MRYLFIFFAIAACSKSTNQYSPVPPTIGVSNYSTSQTTVDSVLYDGLKIMPDVEPGDHVTPNHISNQVVNLLKSFLRAEAEEIL